MRRDRKLSVLVAMALALPALLCCAGQALAAPAWLPPTDLSAPLRDSEGTKVAMDDAGGTVAVWERQESGFPSREVQASTREPGQAFSAPLTLASHAQQPAVAMTPGGEAIVCWWHFVNPPGVYVLEASTRRPGGGFSPPEPVAELPPGVQLSQIQLAVDPTGDAVLAWISREPAGPLPSTTFIQAALRPAGGGFSEPEVVSPAATFPEEDAFAPSVAIDAGGEAVVAWALSEVEEVETEPGEFEEVTESVIQAALAPSGGKFSSPQRLSPEGGNAFSPAVATDSGGDAVAVWTRGEGEEFVAEASARPAGQAFQPAVGLSPSGADAFSPEIAMTPSGEATAIWVQSKESVQVVEAATRPAGGEFSGAQPISAEGEQPLFPAIAVDAAANAVVSWSGVEQSGHAARAVTRVGEGGFSLPVGISAAQPECCLHPDAAIDRAGNAAVVWNRSNGANRIAQAAGYDAAPPQIRGLSIPATGTVGIPVSFAAQPFDVWPIASTAFDFGDGAGAAGTAVAHTYSSPGVFTVTATAVDSAGTPATASGTIAIAPSNAFRLGRLKRNRRAGTATLSVQVPGPGRLSLSGRGVRRDRASARRSGSLKLRIRPSGRTLKRLGAKGKAHVTVTVTFSPDGGTPASQRRAILLVMRRPGHAHRPSRA